MAPSRHGSSKTLDIHNNDVRKSSVGASAASMQRSSTNSSTVSSNVGSQAAMFSPLSTGASSGCSCGHEHLPLPPWKTPNAKGTSGKSKSLLSGATSASAWKRQKELRDFAMVDRLLSRILWLRFYEDAARLYSTRLTLIAKERLPYLLQNIIACGGGPGWACANAFSSEEVREFFRMQIQVDLRELEDRVWHISSEWTYTAIRRMAIANGFTISPSGLRAGDLLNLVPLLQAMCKELENAPVEVHQFQPIRPIASTFLSLMPQTHPVIAKSPAQPLRAKPTISPDIPHICAHHAGSACTSASASWGPSLYRIFGSSKLDASKPNAGAKAGQNNPMSNLPTPDILFDALFPPGSPLSPSTKAHLREASLQDNSASRAAKTGAQKSKPAPSGFTTVEMAHAQAELQSLIALGLSRLMIVLFQTANEFNIRAFGEHVNMAFGGCGATVDDDTPSDGTEADGDWYGGCECCLGDWDDAYGALVGRKSSSGKLGNTSHPISGSDPFDELWNSFSSAYGPPSLTPSNPNPHQKRKSVKRARRSSDEAVDTAATNSDDNDSIYPLHNTARMRATRYRGLFSPRPGAGLKAWDTVLHYEAVIREEEEEKLRRDIESRSEREKYGLVADPLSGKNGLGANKLRPGQKSAKTDDDKRRTGKAKENSESDGRGGGVLGWNSCHEEDVWERDLDNGDDWGLEDHFGFISKYIQDDGYCEACRCRRVALRYLLAEEYKEEGNAAFKTGNYLHAVDMYTQAHKSEPRLPIYLLNRAMALLKLNRFQEAELDCSAVLRKHRCNAKALWRRAKARRILSQISGDVDKLIEAERDLLDFLAILPNSTEGHQELASIRAELCPCFECTSSTALSLYCSTSSTQMPSSCFNSGYRPPAQLTSSLANTKCLEGTTVGRSADVFSALPKGWLADTNTTSSKGVVKKAVAGSTVKVGLNQTDVAKPLGPARPWFGTTPTGASREHWFRYVQDFSLVPESVSSNEDRIPLRFVSEHDVPSAILPGWDVYCVKKAVPASK